MRGAGRRTTSPGDISEALAAGIGSDLLRDPLVGQQRGVAAEGRLGRVAQVRLGVRPTRLRRLEDRVELRRHFSAEY